MSNTTNNDGEYPYSQSGASTLAAQSELRAHLLAQARTWRWVRRLLISAAAFLGSAIVGLAVFGYRVVSHSWLVAELERRDCIVRHYGEPVIEDALPTFLCDWFGERWSSNVAEVSDTYQSILRKDGSAEEIKAICALCAGLPRLRSFETKDCNFSFEQIARWPRLSQIEELDVTTKQLSGADLAVLAKMVRLKKLGLNSPSLNAAAVEQLSMLPVLEELSLNAVKCISPAAAPSGFRSLKRLELDNSPEVTDDHVIALGPLPVLKELLFFQTPIGDRGLEHFLSGGKLHWMIMLPSRVTDAGLRLIAKCPGTLTLHLSDAPISDDGLRALAGKQFDSLLLDNTSVTDAGLIAIGPLSELHYFSLDGTKVTGTGLTCLDPAHRTPIVSLGRVPLTRQGISVVAKLNVEDLCLAKTPIADSDLMLFANNDDIAQLDVKGTKVTAGGVRALYEARKQRLSKTGRSENLLIVSDFAGLAEEYLPESEAWRIADHF